MKKFYFVFFVLLFSLYSKAQIPTDGDFRSKSSGQWSSSTTWQVRIGGNWVDASGIPSAISNVYIQNAHTIDINAAISNCNDLHINTSAILQIGTNVLQLSGKIRAYTGIAVFTIGSDGGFYSGQASSINPVNSMLVTTGAGLLKFIGNTRFLTQSGEWGAVGINHATEFALNVGATGTLQSGYKSSSILISSGTINMLTNRLAPDNGTAGGGDCTIQTGAVLISAGSANPVMSRTGTAATGVAGTFTLNGKLILSGASPNIEFSTINIHAGSTIEYSGGTQSMLEGTYTGAVQISTYGSILFTGSGNKNPISDFTVLMDLTIASTAVLNLSSPGRNVNVAGNWTNYASAGLAETNSTINFNGSGPQTLNTTGGEIFYVLKKSGSGTLTLNSNVRVQGGGTANIEISDGILDAGAYTLDGSASTFFYMSSGVLKFGKLNVTLPEFPAPATSYFITGGTIELNGAGNQILRGSRYYVNLKFSTFGIKTFTSAIPDIAGTVTIADAAILDVNNNGFGNSSTNLTMLNTAKLINAGSDVLPKPGGFYSLASGTTIEFAGTSASLIRVNPDYANVEISGSNVSMASDISKIRFQSGGSFTVKSSGIFKVINTFGFSGATNTVIDNTNNPSITLEPGSTIEYNGADQQITNAVVSIPPNSNYMNLVLSGAGIKTAPAGILKMAENLIGAGTTTFAHNNSSVQFNGSASQYYASTTPFTFYNVVIDNPAEVVTSSPLSLIRELSFTSNAKLKLNSIFTLSSSESGTANVGKIPATNTIFYGTGKFQVERFIATGTTAGKHPKSWQLLSVPTHGMNESVNAAWQEGNTPLADTASGFGTTITSEKAGAVSRGYDFYTPAGPSIKTFDNAIQNWIGIDDGITHTNTRPIANEKGYMILVRGDRSVQTAAADPNSVILRTSGKIYSPGDAPPVVNIASGGFASVGNPYASAIDLTMLNKSGIDDIFYVWDPRLTTSANSAWGLGGWRTLTRNGTTYDVTPVDATGSYGATNKLIQSGQAFLVTSMAGGTITFDEDDKVSGSNLVTRQAMLVSGRINTDLNVRSNNNLVQLDGVMSRFHYSFTNMIDRNDARKMSGTGETISIWSSSNDLSVEKRNTLFATDTIFYRISGLSRQEYVLTINMQDLEGIDAVLVDRFLKTEISIKADGVSSFPFTVTNEPATTASDRFYIVLRNNKGINEGNVNDLIVMPNPVTDQQISFRLTKAGKYQISLSNTVGKVVLKREIESTDNALNTIYTSVIPGIYMLTATDKTGRQSTQQVIIQ